jgi:uncharacterized protein (TIRG00374 family)
LLAAVVAEMLSIVVNAIRWRWLFWPHHRPRFGRLFGVLTVAQLTNMVLPGRTGLLARAILMGEKDGISRATTLTTLVVEKVLEGVTLFPLGVVLVLALDLPAWLRISAGVGGCIVLVIFIILASGLRWRDALQARIVGLWGGRLSGLVGEFLAGLDALRSSRVGWRLWGWSLIYWGVVAAINWLVIQATGLVVPALAPWVLLFVLQVGVRLPSSPGDIGVFDYLGVLSLALFGVAKAPALAVTLLLHLVLYLPPSLVGAAYLLWMNTDLDFRSESNGAGGELTR